MELNQNSLWDDKNISATVNIMEPEQRFKYQKMAEILFNKVSESNVYCQNFEAASQIKIMLRDGLHPSMLNENERQIYIDTYGLKSLEIYAKDDDDN